MRLFFLQLAAGLIALLPLAVVAQTAALPAGSFSRLPSGTEYQLFRKDAAGRYQARPLAPAADAP